MTGGSAVIPWSTQVLNRVPIEARKIAAETSSLYQSGASAGGSRPTVVKMIEMNDHPKAAGSSVGGVKISGNNPEGSARELEGFLEIRAVSGWSEMSDSAAIAN